MTEEQKRFKITKKESYEKQISKENKNVATYTFSLGLTSASMIVGFLAASRDGALAQRAFMTALGLLTSGASAYNLKSIITAISKKTMLQGKVEDINTELEMLENNESRGMKR